MRPSAPKVLRVAQIITRLNIGGASVVALLLAARLDPSRFTTLVLAGSTEHDEGDIRDVRRGDPVRVQAIPRLHRSIDPVGDIRAFGEVTAALRRFRPHIVHTHLAKAGLLGRISAWSLRTPVIVHTFHGNVLSGYFDPVRTGVFRALERTMARASDAIIAISPQQTAEIQRLGVARPPKLVEIPLGLDLDPLREGVRGRFRATLGVAANAPLIGIVARLVPIKAVDLFIRAAAEVARARSDVHFVVVGDGEQRVALEQLAVACGIRERCSFVGWRDDLPEIYADLDVLALTSRNEGLPVSLIEASAAGRAVVATAVGGVPDLVAHGVTGLLVPPGDVGNLSRAMLRLVEDAVLCERLGLAAQAQAFARYGANALVTRTQDLYLALAAEQGLIIG